MKPEFAPGGDPGQFAVPAKPPRPGIVTAAAAMQFAVFGVSLISTILGFLAVRTIMPELVAAADQEGLTAAETQQLEQVVNIFYGAASFCLLLYPGAFALLGIWTLRGVNGVRIAVWVMAGIAALCGMLNLSLSAVGSASTFTGGTGTSGSDPYANIDVEGMLPGWYQGVGIGGSVVNLLLYVGVIVLLLLPKAHEYFRPAPKHLPPAAHLPYQPPQ